MTGSMANVIPIDNPDLLVWAEQHAQVFAAEGEAIGLAPVNTASFSAANSAMQAAWLANNQAQAAARLAAQAWAEARAAFRREAAAEVGLIKNFAARQGPDDAAAVYHRAQISVPRPRSGPLTPSAPEALSAQLDTQTGAVVVRWTARQPEGMSGVIYRVQRCVDAQEAFTEVAQVGGKSFTDGAVPVGAGRIQYRIIAQRSAMVSPASATLDVRLGTGVGEGGEGGAGVKMAA